MIRIRRFLLRRLSIFLFLSAVIWVSVNLSSSPVSKATRQLVASQVRNLRETTRQSEVASRLRTLRQKLEERYPTSGWASHRPATLIALDRLADCTDQGTCGPGELTVIILGSYHFGHSQTGHTSGEDTWAGSLVELMKTHNYTLIYTFEVLEALLVYQAIPDLIPLVFLESLGREQCFKLSRMSRQAIDSLEPSIAGTEYLEPGEKAGCVKQVGFEGGIPAQKIRVFHYWRGERHPLTGWTVSPENYTEFGKAEKNYYLGYWLPHCENVTPATQRMPRAFILGNRPEYFDDSNYAWGRNMLPRLALQMSLPGKEFSFVGGVGRVGVDRFAEPGIVNLGAMEKETWNGEVQRSAVLLGIGKPLSQPSPYDAWCLGVPFINPVMSRDPKEPANRAKWKTQHDGLVGFDPPYVYHVPHDDEDALVNALRSAVDTPITPFIPERMRRESVDERLEHLIHHNWTAEAEAMVWKGEASGFWIPQRPGVNAFDGLLL